MMLTDLSMIKELPSYCLKDKVTKICKPLFDKFPISYFNYMCKYPDNKLSTLLTNGDWMDYYLQKNYRVLINGQKIHPWTANIPPQALEDAAIKFNLYNGILILIEKVHQDYIEVLEFASPDSHSSPLGFCYNKDLLNEFFVYFKNKAGDLIKIIEKEPLCFPENKFNKIAPQETTYPSYIEFLQMIKTKKIHFKFKSEEVTFSRREYQTLCLLAKGKNMKEAAEILELSHRTVEAHLYVAKNRTHAFTTTRLLEEFTNQLFC